MNITFNFNRFTKLFANEWLLNARKIMFFWTAMIGLAVLYFGMCAMTASLAYASDTLIFSYFLVLVFQGFIISIHFNEFSSKTKTQVLLLQPASQTETFMAKFVITMVVYPILALFYIYFVVEMAEIYTHWAVIAFEKQEAFSYYYRAHWSLSDLTEYELWMYLSGWLFAASAFLSGVTIFKKMYMIKTYVVWILFLFLLIPVTRYFYFFVSWELPEIYVPLLAIGVKDENDFSLVETYPYFPCFLSLLVSIFLILIARVKYNEKII